jgi:hypothetical protein
MVTKEREIAGRRAPEPTNGDRQPEWKIPRGGDIREVTRDATEQVIKRYGEALDKLKKH